MLPWDDLRVLLAAHRHGSLTRAAADLDVSVSTVSRRLAAFEEALGQPLFARTPDGLVPTPLAAVLGAHAERIEREVVDAETAMMALDQAPAGTVRLAASDDVMHLVLIPSLLPLLQQYPALRLTLVQGQGVADLARREADVALRVALPEHGEELVTIRVRDVPLGVFATAGYLAGVDRPADPTAHRWIAWTADPLGEGLDSWWAEVGIEPVLRVTNLTSMRLAAAAGLGVAVVPQLFAALTPGLVPVPVAVAGPRALPLYLITHRAIRDAPRIRAVWDFLAALLRPSPDADDLDVLRPRQPGS
jgi:DNA-binding transcriptional LysR family regulator